MVGYPIRMTLKCYDRNKQESQLLKSIVLQEMVKRGFFFSPGPTFISFSHTIQDIELTLLAFEEVTKKLQNIKEDQYENILEGNMPQTIFTNYIEPTKKSNSKLL